jgi:lipid-A-disaccharide synthase
MKVLVSAGEISGDIHGAHLVRELQKLKPGSSFFGMGSDRLAAAGVDVKFDISRRGTIGILEAIPNILPIYSTFLRMKRLALQERPDLVLLIDSQGFNIPFARFCKKAGLRTVYYIAPQQWLWGTPKGVRQVAESVDLIVAIFPQEHEAYRAAGANVIYEGHPLIDIIGSRAQGQGPRKGLTISICPGSRTQEIRNLFPVLLKAAELIKQERPEAEFVMPVPSTGIIEEMFPLVGDFHPKAVAGQTDELLAASDLAICTSGTINLEASLLGTPNIMVYKLSRLTYLIGKHLLKITQKIKYFSMPNILLDEKVIPELVMENATPEKIAAEALAIITDRGRQEGMKRSFATLKGKLGKPGVITRVAASILNQPRSS